MGESHVPFSKCSSKKKRHQALFSYASTQLACCLYQTLKSDELLEQFFIAFNVVRISDNAVGDRADRLAGRFVVMPFALGALVRVDLVDLVPHGDRLVRTFGITHITVNALAGNKQCHIIDRLSARAGCACSHLSLGYASADRSPNPYPVEQG